MTRSTRTATALIATVLLALPAHAAPASLAAVPHLSDAGQAGYAAYRSADGHRAFAIAPGGAYGWVSGLPTRELAESAALERCKASTRQKCALYDVDGAVVHDAKAWTASWGPYATGAEAAKAPVGAELGGRFPDLAYATPKGERRTLASTRGKVAVVHFWGSWCGPCRQEMPVLQTLHGRLADRRDVEFVLLQVRERSDVSRAWAAAQGIALPMFDSGSTGSGDTKLRLAGGGTLADRTIATIFPTTYVLDKRGIVIFTHVGPVRDWTEYEGFVRDAARSSGR